jgi:hypothetical protein
MVKATANIAGAFYSIFGVPPPGFVHNPRPGTRLGMPPLHLLQNKCNFSFTTAKQAVGCTHPPGPSLNLSRHRSSPSSPSKAPPWSRPPPRPVAVAVALLLVARDGPALRRRTGEFLLAGANDSESAILNLEQGNTVSRWGRLIFHVTDVDAFWTHLKERGFNPEIPRDASWGERYFHMLDPDGHELSFAQPLQ